MFDRPGGINVVLSTFKTGLGGFHINLCFFKALRSVSTSICTHSREL